MPTAQPPKKINVVIVENNLIVGGVQRLVLDQLRTFDRTRFSMQLITLSQHDRATYYDQVPSDVEVTQLHFTGMTDVRSWWQLFRLLRRLRPDIVKSTTYFSNTITRLLRPLVGYVSIAAEHNTKDTKTALQRFINRRLNFLSYTTVTDSQLVAETISAREGVSRERYTVIYNGIDLDAVAASEAALSAKRTDLRAAHQVTPGQSLFFNVGRFVLVKNHIRMIEAMALVKKQRSDCRLIIIGGGAMGEAMTNRVQELEVDDVVEILLPRTDIHQFYVMSDFTLLSSDHEGFCIAAMEGLAFGKPLVSTRVAGVSEYLEDGHNGFFADKTPEDLAAKMIQVMDLGKEEHSQFQLAARKTAEHYSVERYAHDFEHLLLASYQAS